MRRCGKLSTGGKLRRLERNAAEGGGGGAAAASMEAKNALDLGMVEGDGLVDLLA